MRPIAGLLALVCATAASAEGPALGDAVADHQIMSVRKLYKQALSMARGWSSEAALYSMIGTGPRNHDRWKPERWEIRFGDRESKDGLFLVVYTDGVLSGRQGIKDGVKVTEFYEKGRMVERKTALYEWNSNDYNDCRPVAKDFLDTIDLEEIIWELNMKPNDVEQYRFALFRPATDQCDGLGHLSLFLTEKPIPKKLKKKSLWVVTGEEMTVYFSARSGKPLRRRTRLKSPSPSE